jgi:Phage ABA sandwich domain
MTNQQIIETLATKVMGWKVLILDETVYVGGETGYCRIWNPLQNIADAWMIVQKMAKADPVASHKFQEALSMYCIYDITPERICQAAWKAIA